MDVVPTLQQLFERHGAATYDGRLRESVSALEHALQCAQLAEHARADATLVVAALLHDIGHFIAPAAQDDTLDDEHETRAYGWLRAAFGPRVAEPVRLHVAAKRYLVATDAGYAATLSAASQHTLRLQGGPMTAAEVQRFETEPLWSEAVQLRRWDDLAKDPGRPTPPLGYYLALVEQLEPVAPAADFGA